MKIISLHKISGLLALLSAVSRIASSQLYAYYPTWEFVYDLRAFSGLTLAFSVFIVIPFKKKYVYSPFTKICFGIILACEAFNFIKELNGLNNLNTVSQHIFFWMLIALTIHIIHYRNVRSNE